MVMWMGSEIVCRFCIARLRGTICVISCEIEVRSARDQRLKIEGEDIYIKEMMCFHIMLCQANSKLRSMMQ